jgi:Glycine rich protein
MRRVNRPLARIAGIGAVCVLTGPAVAGAVPQTVSFRFTGTEQTFVVAARVANVHVVAVGGRGGNGLDASGGFGAIATADLSVTPGQLLDVEVAGNGTGAASNGPGADGGGFNGGGGAPAGGGGGGGASDVRTESASAPDALASRLIVAAGGGGGGGDRGDFAGIEGTGGAAGATGGGDAGQPGTATAGGSGSVDGGATGGTLGVGGSGGPGDPFGGGGGGGGLYGGGGGNGSYTMCRVWLGLCDLHYGAGGGGGGSSGFGPSATNTSLGPDTIGVPSVTVSYDQPPPRNDFTLSSPTANSLHTITLRAQVPGAGHIRTIVRVNLMRPHATGTARSTRITYGTTEAVVRKTGTTTLRIRPTTLASKELAKHHTLSATIAVTFTPTGGTPNTETKQITITSHAR